MSVTLNDLQDFHRFAEAKLNNSGAESLGELFDLWQIEHPTADVAADVHEAIQQGLADIDAGRYRPADLITAEIRAKHGIRRQ